MKVIVIEIVIVVDYMVLTLDYIVISPFFLENQYKNMCKPQCLEMSTYVLIDFLLLLRMP